MSGKASVTGSGVMIVNAGSNYPGTGGTYGSIAQSGNSTINLSPTDERALCGDRVLPAAATTRRPSP